MADTIKSLLALDDSALLAKLGLGQKLQDFKDSLTKAAALPDDQKADVEKQLAKMFGPHDYMVSDFNYTVESAERRALKAKSLGVKGSEVNDCLKSFDCCDCAPSVH